MNSYDDVNLSIVYELNSTILNNSFTKLLENDNLNFPEYNYVPHIWENKWFNEEAIPGYSKGYSVWRNTYTNLTEFLDMYGDIVYSYAQEHDVLQNYLTKSWTNIKNKNFNIKEMERWYERYRNVITGYTVDGQQLYEPLFNYGNTLDITSPNPAHRIELYVSTIDNNKELLSNTTAWHTIILSDDNAYQNYIETEINILFDEHIKNYHMDGDLTKSKINDLLLHRNLSNFNIINVQNQIIVNNHDQYLNVEGFDFIISSAYKEEKDFFSDINGNKYIFYKGFRLWNSGYLEHFGVVKNNKVTQGYLSNIKSYYTTVNLDWEISSGVSAPIYNYPETSAQYSDVYKYLYYGNNSGDDTKKIVETFDIYDNTYISTDCRYTVTITPLQFNPNRDFNENNLFNDISVLSCIDYPTIPLKTKNQTYITTEIHHLKNNSFKITRSDTDNLIDNENNFQLYSYYVTGYRVTTDPNKED